jgi:hypothetical protein
LTVAGNEPTLDHVVSTEINGNTFLSGLIWRRLNSPRTYMSEAKRIGRELKNMEMVAIRKGRTIQAGFAPKQADHKSRRALRQMYSLAACVAGRLGENGIGVFALPSGRYAFVAVHKGAVLPGLDIVGDREEMLKLLRENYSLMTSSKTAEGITVIAPQDFGGDAKHETLEELLSGASLSPEHRLQPLRFGLTKQEWMLYAGSAVALAVMGVGAAAWWRHHKLAVQEEIDAANAQAIASKNAEALAKAQAALVRTWQHMPDARDMIDACEDVMLDTDVSLGGWVFASAKCYADPLGNRSADYVEVVYRGGAGMTPTSAFLGAVKELGAAASITRDAQGNTMGTLRRRLARLDGKSWKPLENPTRQKPVSELPLADDQIASLVDVVESLPKGLANTSAELVPWSPPKENPNAPAPDWRTYTLTITTKLPADELLKQQSLGGVWLTSIDVARDGTSNGSTETHFTTTLHGNIYGR